MADLKPCPFCGSAPVLLEGTRWNGRDYYASVWCRECDIRPFRVAKKFSAYTARYEAVEAWNRRAADDSLRAENERLRLECTQLATRSGMLSAVHGALIDAGCTVGELGRCEAGLVRELAARAEVLQGAWNTAEAERTRLTGEVERLTRERDDPEGR